MLNLLKQLTDSSPIIIPPPQNLLFLLSHDSLPHQSEFYNKKSASSQGWDIWWHWPWPLPDHGADSREEGEMLVLPFLSFSKPPEDLLKRSLTAFQIKTSEILVS